MTSPDTWAEVKIVSSHSDGTYLCECEDGTLKRIHGRALYLLPDWRSASMASVSHIITT